MSERCLTKVNVVNIYSFIIFRLVYSSLRQEHYQKYPADRRVDFDTPPPEKKIQVYLKLKFNVCCLYKDGRAGAHLTFFNTIRAVG